MLLLEGLGEPLFLASSSSRGACIPWLVSPSILKDSNGPESFSSGISLTLALLLPLPVIRTLVMTLGLFTQSRIISPSQGPEVNHICQVLIPWRGTCSHVLRIRMWTLGPWALFCLSRELKRVSLLVNYSEPLISKRHVVIPKGESG